MSRSAAVLACSMDTHNAPPIKLPVHLALELRIRAILIRQALDPLLEHFGTAEGELAGCLKVAREHAAFIGDALRDCGLQLAVDGWVQ